MTAQVVLFPRAHDQAPKLSTFIRQCLQARGDVRLRSTRAHLLGPRTGAIDDAINRVLAAHGQRFDTIERALATLIKKMDGEVQR
jgi:hypothetical protein